MQNTREEASLIETDAMAHLRHHLRTPLSHIIGYSDLLIDEAAQEGNESLLHDLEKIKGVGTTLLALLNEALDSQQIGAGRGGVTGLYGDMPLPEPACAEEAAAASALGRILVVDDSEDNRAMPARRLRGQGHVVEAGDGQ